MKTIKNYKTYWVWFIFLFFMSRSLSGQTQTAPSINVGDKEAFYDVVGRENPKVSIVDEMGVDHLPIPKESEILSAFGAYYDTSSKKFIFRNSEITSVPSKYFLLSLFPIPGVPPEKMQDVVTSSQCGRRGFETIVAYKKQSDEDRKNDIYYRVGLIWSCSRGCLGVMEKTKSSVGDLKTVLAVSPLVGISEQFCTSIWGGIISIDDKSSERFIK